MARWSHGSASRDSSMRVREAYEALLAAVNRGAEYPDAEERVARRYGLNLRETARLRALYDAQV